MTVLRGWSENDTAAVNIVTVAALQLYCRPSLVTAINSEGRRQQAMEQTSVVWFMLTMLRIMIPFLPFSYCGPPPSPLFALVI